MLFDCVKGDMVNGVSELLPERHFAAMHPYLLACCVVITVELSEIRSFSL